MELSVCVENGNVFCFCLIPTAKLQQHDCFFLLPPCQVPGALRRCVVETRGKLLLREVLLAAPKASEGAVGRGGRGAGGVDGDGGSVRRTRRRVVLLLQTCCGRHDLTDHTK